MLLCFALFANVANAQKLIAKAHIAYNSNGNVIQDSIVYYHSGTKGNNPGKYKIPEFELMEDSSYLYEDNGGTPALKSKTLSYYTGTDFDSSVTYEYNNGQWENDSKVWIKYKSNKPDTVFYQSWSSQWKTWRTTSRIIYTWAGNNILTRLRQTYSFQGGGQWRNNRMHTYTWSGSNETSFIDQKWSTSGGGQWVDSIKRETTYSAGKISQVNIFSSSGGNWVNKDRYLHYYDGQGRRNLIQQDIYTSTWENDNGRDSFIYNGTGTYPDTMIRIGKIFPPNFTNIGKWGYKYLTATSGKMTEETSFSWDGTSSWRQANNQDTINHWYWGWNVNVEDVDKAKDMVNVYPSPASDVINISLDGIKEGVRTHFAIVSMDGRLIKNWAENAKATTQMSINEVPAGTYILEVNDGKQKLVRQFVVSK